MDPLTAAVLISSVASLGSAAYNVTRPKPETFAERIEAARSRGISPLSAMGMPLSSGGMAQVGALEPLERMGQDLTRAAQAYSPEAERKAFTTLDLERRKAEVDNVRLQNQSLSLQIQQQQTPSIGPSSLSSGFGIVGQGPIRESSVPPPVRGSLGVDMVKPDVPFSSQLGVQAGVRPFQTDHIDDEGNIWRMPSQEAAEVLESSFPDWLRHNIAQGYRYVHSKFAVLSSRARWNLALDLWNERPSSPVSGYVYRFNLTRAQWRLVRSKEKPSVSNIIDGYKLGRR